VVDGADERSSSRTSSWTMRFIEEQERATTTWPTYRRLENEEEP